MSTDTRTPFERVMQSMGDALKSNTAQNAPNATVSHYQLQTALAELERARADCAELRATLDDVLRDRLTQTNLHHMPPGIRNRLEKARTLLARLDREAS